MDHVSAVVPLSGYLADTLVLPRSGRLNDEEGIRAVMMTPRMRGIVSVGLRVPWTRARDGKAEVTQCATS